MPRELQEVTTPPMERCARYPQRDRRPPMRLVFDPFDRNGNERMRYEETRAPDSEEDRVVDDEGDDLVMDWVFDLVSSSSDDDFSTDTEYTDPGTPPPSSSDTDSVCEDGLTQELLDLASDQVDSDAERRACQQDRHPHLLLEEIVPNKTD